MPNALYSFPDNTPKTVRESIIRNATTVLKALDEMLNKNLPTEFVGVPGAREALLDGTIIMNWERMCGGFQDKQPPPFSAVLLMSTWIHVVTIHSEDTDQEIRVLRMQGLLEDIITDVNKLPPLPENENGTE
jgi:hypothetical protein